MSGKKYLLIKDWCNIIEGRQYKLDSVMEWLNSSGIEFDTVWSDVMYVADYIVIHDEQDQLAFELRFNKANRVKPKDVDTYTE
jgi:hypothetical protein